MHFQKKQVEAELLYHRVLHLQALAGGTHSLTFTSTLISLALLLLSNGGKHVDEADEMLKKALQLREEVFGRDHPSCAVVIHNLSLVCAVRRNYMKAGKLLEESTETNRKAFGKRSQEVALGLMNIERLMVSQGNESLVGDLRDFLTEGGFKSW